MKYLAILYLLISILNTGALSAQACGIKNVPVQSILNDMFLEEYIPDSLLAEQKFLRHYSALPVGEFYFKGNKCKVFDQVLVQDSEVFFNIQAFKVWTDTIKVMTSLHYSYGRVSNNTWLSSFAQRHL